MKVFRILPFLFFCLVIKSYSQMPVGGATISAFVCSQGQVYAWGLNQQGYGGSTVKGTLGTGNTSSQNIPTPTQVIFPAGVTIKSIGGISGGYLLALDCSGKVWGWGDNGAGQLGIGNTTSQTSPQKVLVQAGSAVDLAGFRDPLTGQLKRIVKVFAGNSTSLAITDDGQLLSWGCGGTGCDPIGEGLLGNGNPNGNASYPTFVKDGNGGNLQNVRDASIGDNLAIALVNETQVDIGSGTVYSWGTGRNGTLGRNTAGTANSTTETTADYVARRVKMPTSTGGPAKDGYLSNIISISAGDVAGYALDIDGHVWAWGNGGYGGLTGQGTTVTHSDPRKVLKGESNGDGTYLIAISIAAGNGFAMAVTIDGKPVAWGNNACSGNSAGPAANPNFACGGNLGNNGIGINSSVPTYIQNSSGTVHSDVKAVSRGDYWGYYLRADNSIWAWGDNIVGQLGIGGYTTQNKAVVFAPIQGCTQSNPSNQCVITGVETDENITNTNYFKLYPNPSSSFFTLASPETSHIRVLDFNGKEIENIIINGTEQIGENWASGIYVLLVNAGSSSRSYKLSKVR